MSHFSPVGKPAPPLPLKPDLVINLVGSVRGVDALSSVIPGLLEILDIPFTGAKHAGETLSFNKYLILKLMEKSLVPVPRYQLILDSNEPLKASLRFPLISKLNEVHGAVDINEDAVSENEGHLRARIRNLMETYKQPVLIQEFVIGREVTAIFFEGLDREVFMAEKIFSNTQRKFVFATFDAQWLEGKDTFKYQKYEDAKLADLVRKAFYAAKMGDYGKFDIRISRSKEYFFIDANSNPAFGPKESECALGTILNMYGISFTQILKSVIEKHICK